MRSNSNVAKLLGALTGEPKTISELLSASGAEVKLCQSGAYAGRPQLGAYHSALKALVEAGKVVAEQLSGRGRSYRLASPDVDVSSPPARAPRVVSDATAAPRAPRARKRLALKLPDLVAPQIVFADVAPLAGPDRAPLIAQRDRRADARIAQLGRALTPVDGAVNVDAFYDIDFADAPFASDRRAVRRMLARAARPENDLRAQMRRHAQKMADMIAARAAV